MKVWILLLENVEGENSVEVYSTQEKAYAAFDSYATKNKEQYGLKQYGFEKYCDGCFAWFGSEYVDHYSYISICEKEVL